MAIVKFGQINSGTGASPFYRPKLLPTPHIKTGLDIGMIPIMRAGTSNYITSEQVTPESGSDPSLLYFFSTATGTSVLVNTINMADYGSGCKAVALYVSSADQCVYVLTKTSANLVKLLKINDTTGNVTEIGSFTPTTPANWPSLSNTGVFYEEGGSLTFIYWNYRHVINKTTGAIVSQDTLNYIPTTTTPYVYASLDGTNYMVSHFAVTGSNTTRTDDLLLSIPTIYNTTSGFTVGGCLTSSILVFGTSPHLNSTAAGYDGRVYPIRYIDSDKVCILRHKNLPTLPFVVMYRSEYDKLIKSVVDYYSGV